MSEKGQARPRAAARSIPARRAARAPFPGRRLRSASPTPAPPRRPGGPSRRSPTGSAGRAWLAAALLAALGGALPAVSANFSPADEAAWPLPDADLHAVALHGQTALAVGYWGTVLRSEDSGATWSYRATPTAETLFAVNFADARRAWAVGNRGTVLHSEDGGASWRSISIEIPDQFGDAAGLRDALFGVAAPSREAVWIVGDFGLLLHSADGATWRRVEISEEMYGDEELPDRLLNSVQFSDPRRGWIIGEFGTALRTDDGGQTWTNRREIRGAIEDIYLFAGGTNGSGQGVATGTGGVTLLTRDGGESWQAVTVPTTAGLFGAAFRGDRAVLVGDRGEIAASRDGGQSWFRPERPKGFQWLQGVAFGPGGLVLVVGEGGLILRSTDGGERFAAAAVQP